MSVLLAYTQVDHCYNEDDRKEHQRRRARKTVVLGYFEVVLNMSYDGVHISTAGNRFGFTEDTDDTGVFLKSADKAGDNNVGQHGGEKRNCDLGKNAPLGSAVDLSRVVVLLVDALQASEKNKDLEGKSVPYNINDWLLRWKSSPCCTALVVILPTPRFSSKLQMA